MKRKQFFIAVTTALTLLLAMASIAAAQSHATMPASDIDPANFVRHVTNKFFPLRPGTTFLYKGTKDGVPTSDTVFVTHETKRILGVICTVVRDQAFEDGVLVEDTFDWYAQDVDGNVWYFGEDTKELDEHGNVISTEGSWEAGVNGAQPGIIMEAHPRVGDRYQQERTPDVAEDMAQVLSLDASACVGYGCFDDLLLTKEWTPLERGVVEHKYYAKGIGFILGVMVKGGHERTELVRITTEREDD
jgi:hypothetical protein